MSFEFPFEYANVQGLGKLFYPVVRFQVKTVWGWKEFEFLVDTGADITTFPSSLLPIFGINKKKLKTSVSGGVGGISVRLWEFTVQLKVGKLEFTAAAGAVETNGRHMPLLLGRKDIFEEKFNLLLDSKNKMTVISENKNSKA